MMRGSACRVAATDNTVIFALLILPFALVQCDASSSSRCQLDLAYLLADSFLLRTCASSKSSSQLTSAFIRPIMTATLVKPSVQWCMSHRSGSCGDCGMRWHTLSVWALFSLSLLSESMRHRFDMSTFHPLHRLTSLLRKMTLLRLLTTVMVDTPPPLLSVWEEFQVFDFDSSFELCIGLQQFAILSASCRLLLYVLVVATPQSPSSKYFSCDCFSETIRVPSTSAPSRYSFSSPNSATTTSIPSPF